MKKIIIAFILTIFILMDVIYASGEAHKKMINDSGEENYLMMKNENIEDRKTQGNSQKNLSEEGANVDTSMTEKNYNVETPTIVILVIFGFLLIVSFILFMFKI